MSEISAKNEINLIFQNESFVAVFKPEGIASISESDNSIETTHSFLEEKLSNKLLIVHRLDKEVSGIILFAKSKRAHKILNQLFYEREIKKTYLALVHGNVESESGSINKAIREFGSGRMGIDEEKGKRSFTAYKIIKRFQEYTLLELNPTTGRRHQLRVHLYAMGHPIIGDSRYGEREIQNKYSRLMLHAKSLEFVFDKKSFHFLCEPNDTFSSELSKITSNN